MPAYVITPPSVVIVPDCGPVTPNAMCCDEPE